MYVCLIVRTVRPDRTTPLHYGPVRGLVWAKPTLEATVPLVLGISSRPAKYFHALLTCACIPPYWFPSKVVRCL